MSIQVAPLAWALIATAAARDDDGREALLEEIETLDDAYAVVTGLAAAAAGLLLGLGRSDEATVKLLRAFVFEIAAAEGNRP